MGAKKASRKPVATRRQHSTKPSTGSSVSNKGSAASRVSGHEKPTKGLARPNAPKAKLKEAKEPWHKRSTRGATRFRLGHFSFLKLPPEIRNKIYIITLMPANPIHIGALLPEEYDEESITRSIKRTHWSIKIRNNLDPLGSNAIVKMSYTAASDLNEEVPSVAMLQLNHQIREEAVSIFYGLNTFHFENAKTFIPFLKDRPNAVGFINNLKITISHEDVGGTWRPGHGYKNWIRAFSQLAKRPILNINKLVLDIEGHEDDLTFSAEHGFNLKLGHPTYQYTSRWVHFICTAFKDLDMLGLTYRCDMDSFSYPSYNTNGWVPIDEAIDKVEGQMWDWLAPRMLKQSGDKGHNEATLLHRRVPSGGDSVRPDYDYSKVDYTTWRRFS